MNPTFIEKIVQLEKIIIELKQMYVQPKKEMNTKFLRKKTIDFIADLKQHYGNRIIKRNDKLVKDLLYKHRITDLSQILHRLESENIVIVERSETHRIKSFTF
jgi:hypothetical protein